MVKSKKTTFQVTVDATVAAEVWKLAGAAQMTPSTYLRELVTESAQSLAQEDDSEERKLGELPYELNRVDMICPVSVVALLWEELTPYEQSEVLKDRGIDAWEPTFALTSHECGVILDRRYRAAISRTYNQLKRQQAEGVAIALQVVQESFQTSDNSTLRHCLVLREPMSEEHKKSGCPVRLVSALVPDLPEIGHDEVLPYEELLGVVHGYSCKPPYGWDFVLGPPRGGDLFLDEEGVWKRCPDRWTPSTYGVLLRRRPLSDMLHATVSPGPLLQPVIDRLGTTRPESTRLLKNLCELSMSEREEIRSARGVESLPLYGLVTVEESDRILAKRRHSELKCALNEMIERGSHNAIVASLLSLEGLEPPPPPANVDKFTPDNVDARYLDQAGPPWPHGEENHAASSVPSGRQLDGLSPYLDGTCEPGSPFSFEEEKEEGKTP